jgi:hypothetical protein
MGLFEGECCLTTLPADKGATRASDQYSPALSAAEEEILRLKTMLLSARDDRVRDVQIHLAELIQLQQLKQKAEQDQLASQREKQQLEERLRHLEPLSIALANEVQRLTQDGDARTNELVQLEAAQKDVEQGLAKLSEDIQKLAHENNLVREERTRLEREAAEHLARQYEVRELTVQLQQERDRGLQSEERAQRTEKHLGDVRARLAKREQEMSQELAARDLLAQELALARRNFEVADHALRVLDQLHDIATRTSHIHRSPRPGLWSRTRTLSALRVIRRGIGIRSFIATERLRRELSNSPLFDAGWYLSQRPDLINQDALDHFLFHGIDEGTSPHPLIDVNWIAGSTGQNPQTALRSYLRHGRHTELRPTPLFDVNYYRKTAGLSASADALSHYLLYGHASGLSPHPLFDPVHYSSQLPRVARRDIDPFLHYTIHPFELDPHPLFSNEHYLRQHPELRALGISPLVHYLECGSREKTSPHWSFSGSAYLAQYPDVAAAELNPLLHYVLFGKAEGRHTQPAI